MKILVVDDDPDSRMILKNMLKSAGHETETAANGNDALQKARLSTPDLIISDILMPDMDGFKLCYEVKKAPKLKAVPFVFYTATYIDPDDERLAMGLGVSRYIVKPVENKEFLRIIDEVVQEARKGELPVHECLLKNDAELLHAHEERVEKKLDKKIKELSRAEKKFREIERSYLNLFNSIRDVIIVTDIDRMLVDANQPALKNLFGYEVDEIKGRTTRMLYADDENYQRLGRIIFDKEEPNEPLITEAEFRTKNGKIFTGEISAQKLKDDKGDIAGNIGIIRDITEQKKLESQLLQAQKMEAVGQLAGGISHDFNNILTAIIGYASLLKMHMSPDDPDNVGVDNILAAAERAAELTRGLLAFSRKQIMKPLVLDMNEIVQNIEKLLVRLIGEDIILKTVPSAGPLSVFVDKSQIEQVLMNLATNARDAMPKGGNLTIKTEDVYLDKDFIRLHGYEINPDRYALLTVSDTGAGMDEKTREKIFEPFFTTKELGKGTGLGLSIVYGIIKQHSGFINCYSEPGIGTTFKIYIPVDKRKAEKSKETSIEDIPQGSETVLFAEDDSSLRDFIATLLTNFGYKVIEAVDGADAVKRFNENKEAVQLVLLDMIMPVMSGKAALDQIKKTSPGIKALFLSGYPTDIIQKESISELEAELIIKPVSPKVLLKKIREVLDS